MRRRNATILICGCVAMLALPLHGAARAQVINGEGNFEDNSGRDRAPEAEARERPAAKPAPSETRHETREQRE